MTITSNARIGKQVIILPNTVISHDDVVGDYTSFAAGVCVSGEVTIGESCYMGTNSTIIGNITIPAELANSRTVLVVGIISLAVLASSINFQTTRRRSRSERRSSLV